MDVEIAGDSKARLGQTIDVFWLMLTALFVFFMQAGFGMLEAGAVRRKAVKSIIMKNVLDINVSALTFWLFGYALAYGCRDGVCHPLVGNDLWALDGLEQADDPNHKGLPKSFSLWFFKFAYAATASTIVSGSVAERCRFACYIMYTFFITGIIYPVVAHWVWGGGWLSEHGVIDWGGSGVVHMVGGCTGIVGAATLGPRLGRFQGEQFKVTTTAFQSYSIVFHALGVLIMWMGWYGFTCGSTEVASGRHSLVALIAINTTLAPAGGALAVLLFTSWESDFERIHFDRVLNGVLGGLVSVSAGCAVFQPALALVCGVVGGAVYLLGSNLLKQLKVDDPVDAAPVHFFCGVWGVLAVGLFASPQYVELALPSAVVGEGLFYSGDATLLLWQTTFVLSATAWTVTCSALVFGICRMGGFARLDAEAEVYGNDAKHFGRAEKKESALAEVLATLGLAHTNLLPHLLSSQNRTSQPAPPHPPSTSLKSRLPRSLPRPKFSRPHLPRPFGSRVSRRAVLASLQNPGTTWPPPPPPPMSEMVPRSRPAVSTVEPDVGQPPVRTQWLPAEILAQLQRPCSQQWEPPPVPDSTSDSSFTLSSSSDGGA